MNIPVCVAIVVWDGQGRVAASARRHDHDSWGLPGGKLEPLDGDADDLANELELALRRAVIRELYEETGLIVDLDVLLESGSFRSYNQMVLDSVMFE